MIARTSLRTGCIFLVCVVILTLGGLVAFVSHRPDHPRVVAAERWPGVGAWVVLLREVYRPAETVRVGGPTTDPPERHLARRAAEGYSLPPWDGPPGYVWVPDGATLRTEPSDGAAEIHRFDAIANVARLERRGDWFRVWRRGVEGWVHLPGYREEHDLPPWGDEPEAPGPLAPESIDPSLLAEALSFLEGAAGEEGGTAGEVVATRFGPYQAYADFDDVEIFSLLGAVAEQVEPLWVRRHGLRPSGDPASVVVLFRREAAYRALERSTDQVRGLDAEGFAGYGLVVTYVGDKSPQEVASTLVHEICHRIHRRALGPALPPWLEEGMADDLALARLDDGRLDPGGYSGRRVTDATPRGVEIRFTQGLATLWNLKEAILRGRMPLLEDLTRLDRDAFLDPTAGRPARRLRYDAMALWVRYLLTAHGGRHRDGWQRFLRGIAEGGPATGDALLTALGAPPDALEADFRTWVVLESRKHVGE